MNKYDMSKITLAQNKTNCLCKKTGKRSPVVGHDSVLQSCASAFRLGSQATPPFASCVLIVLNLYCCPVPHVLVQPVQAL